MAWLCVSFCQRKNINIRNQNLVMERLKLWSALLGANSFLQKIGGNNIQLCFHDVRCVHTTFCKVSGRLNYQQPERVSNSGKLMWTLCWSWPQQLKGSLFGLDCYGLLVFYIEWIGSIPCRMSGLCRQGTFHRGCCCDPKVAASQLHRFGRKPAGS